MSNRRFGFCEMNNKDFSKMLMDIIKKDKEEKKENVNTEKKDLGFPKMNNKDLNKMFMDIVRK
jgi:hypothetical protein